jgi:hypothetical protein
MIDDYAIADPAEETLEASGDTSLLQETAQDADTTSTLFCSPVLDRIRTSD